MKYLDECNDPSMTKSLFDDIARITTEPWAIVKVCGGAMVEE